ncbi:MAG: HlyD family efflux transporter periplasmic adaptor subunit [Planctomycetales bacterium]|nr:HlyD family efflux transporter periplasmic adaptor subunit [Planctomycetales bacterium]
MKFNPIGFVSRIIFPLLILAGGVGIAVASFKLRPPPPRQPIPDSTPQVELTELQPYESGIPIETDGVVVPYRELTLSAEVPGRIQMKSADCRAGHAVKPDQVLIRIDPRDYELEIERLVKERAQAEANLKELETTEANTERLIALADEDLELQLREVERLGRLVRDGTVAASQFDSAQRLAVSAKNARETLTNRRRLFETQRDGLESAIQLVDARLAKARLDRERTEIRSPVVGVVVDDQVEQDAYVQPGTPLVTIEDTSAVEVRCMLRTDQLYWLWQQRDDLDESDPNALWAAHYELPQLPATITYEVAGSHFEWDAIVSRYDGIGLDAQTRTVPCRVLVEDPTAVRVAQGSQDAALRGKPPALVRGMFVTIHIKVEPKTGLLTLPQEALKPGNEVWVYHDSKLHRRPVRVAHRFEHAVVIHAEDGLVPSQTQIVTTPLAYVYDGMDVRIATDDETADSASAEMPAGAEAAPGATRPGEGEDR